jgi:hypothetical protein
MHDIQGMSQDQDRFMKVGSMGEMGFEDGGQIGQITTRPAGNFGNQVMDVAKIDLLEKLQMLIVDIGKQKANPGIAGFGKRTQTDVPGADPATASRKAQALHHRQDLHVFSPQRATAARKLSKVVAVGSDERIGVDFFSPAVAGRGLFPSVTCLGLQTDSL